MGLNIGIRVKKQHEGYMSYGSNPKGTSEQIEEELYQRLEQKFPDGAFGLSVSIGKEEYDFDVQFGHYAEEFSRKNYQFNDMYLVIVEYILENFSANNGIDMYVYYSA